MSLSRFSVRRAVLISMVYIGVLGFGIFSYVRLPRDLFPDLTFPVVIVITQYAGAGPEDVEQLVTRPIEGAVASVEGVKEVRSTSRYGLSLVNIEFSWGTNMAKAETDIRKNIDLFARSFLPDDVQEPITFAFDPSLQPVAFMMLSGPDGPAAVRKAAEDIVEPRLERVEGVASVNSAGGDQREIIVELVPERLRALSVPPEQVVNAIRTANLQLPGGAIRQGGQLLSIDTKGRFVSVDEINEVIIMKRPQREIRVKDVARVRDWFKERTQHVTVGGETAVMVMVRKQSDANTVQVVDRVLGQIESIKRSLPEGYDLQVMFDQAEIIKISLGNVIDTALKAFVLAGVVLLIFLFSLRAGLIVASAIPASLMVTFGVMDAAGVTLNIISMSGLALAIGMLVDNAIVVLENIFRHYKMGKEPREAATVGANEVSTAIMASTTTTLSVFLPILFVPGIAGAMFRDMVITICFSLTASFGVAVTLIPMLSSRLLARQKLKKTDSWWTRRLNGISSKASKLIDGYGAFARVCVRFRKTTVFVGFLAFVGSMYLLSRTGRDFFPRTDQGQLFLQVTTDSSNTMETTRKLVDKVMEIVIDEVHEHTLYSANVGTGDGIGAVFGAGEFSAQLRVKLPRLSERKRHQVEIEKDLRERLKDFPGVEVRPGQGPITGGSDIEVEIYIHDLNTARDLGDEVKRRLEAIPGVVDISHDLEQSSPEVSITLNRDRLAQLGTNPGMVTSSISTYFMGAIAGVFQEEGDEFNIVVKAPESFRTDVERLKNAPVFMGTGMPMPLASVARIDDSLAPTLVQRQGQRRLVRVSASVSGRPLGDAVNDVQKTLDEMEWPPEAIWNIGGSAEDMRESFMYLGFALIAGIFLVYMVMASQFESLLEPFVILLSIPMASIGMALALYITNTDLTLTAAIGGLMLVGIVVNNAIVLIDYLKQQWDGKWNTLMDAAVEAGKVRLRPILMTTMTTILAMVPLAIGTGEGAETWAPMARAVIGGLATSMLLTLIVIPSFYVWIAGFRARIRERREAKIEAKIKEMEKQSPASA